MNVGEMEFVFYLAFVKHSSIDENPNDDSIETDIPKMYFKVQTLIEFDSFAATHGPGTYVDGEFNFNFLFARHRFKTSFISHRLFCGIGQT